MTPGHLPAEQLELLRRSFEKEHNKLRQENSNLRRENRCIVENERCGICMDSKIQKTLVPCGHGMCRKCTSMDLTVCPFCRKMIEKVIPRY